MRVSSGWCLVSEVRSSTLGESWYPWAVRGENCAHPVSQPFAWHVSALDWFGYDFSHAKMDDAARTELVRLGLI